MTQNERLKAKQRLIELFETSPSIVGSATRREYYEQTADHFLDNGVLVPPCKVGDEIWILWYKPASKKCLIYPTFVESIVIIKDKWYISTQHEGHFYGDLLNVDWFITQEAAEQALKERD